MHAKRKESLFAFVVSFAATVFVLVLCLRHPPAPFLVILLGVVASLTGVGVARVFMTPDHFYRVEERRYRMLNRRLQPWLVPIAVTAMVVVMLIRMLGPQIRHWLYEY